MDARFHRDLADPFRVPGNLQCELSGRERVVRRVPGTLKKIRREKGVIGKQGIRYATMG